MPETEQRLSSPKSYEIQERSFALSNTSRGAGFGDTGTEQEFMISFGRYGHSATAEVRIFSTVMTLSRATL